MKRQLLVLALCGWVSSSLQAQQKDSLRVEKLEEIAVSSFRTVKRAPFAQVTLSRAEIEKDFQGQDIAFLLERLSPSLVSYSDAGTGFSNYGQMRLRGIDQTRINITLNGVPLNDMIDQGVFFSNFTDFGNSIESVQVQRGVGTSSNGVASYAGSMNFESVSLTRSRPSAEVQFTGGSFNTLRASAEVHTGLMENRTAFYAKMSRLQSDGYRYNSGTESNSIFFSGGYFGVKHALKITGFAGRTQNQLSYTPVPLNLINKDPRTNLLDPNDIDNFGQYLLQAQHTWRLSGNSSLVSTLYYGGAGGDFPFGFTDSATGFNQINYPLTNEHIGFMSNYSLGTSLGSFKVGAHLYTFRRENQELVLPTVTNPYYQDQSQKDETAFFAKWQKNWGPLSFFADVQARFLRLSLSPDNAFLGQEATIPNRDYVFVNPNIGASWDMNYQMQVYASLGRGQREPTRTDILGAIQINTGNLAQAQDLNSIAPEVVTDLELGYRWQASQFSVDVNLFYMIFENEIAPIGAFITEGFYQISLNQSPSFRRGVEVMGVYHVTERLNIDLQLSYLNAEIQSYRPAGTPVTFEEVRPTLSPEWNGQVAINYEILRGLSVGLRGRYISEQAMELKNDPLMVPSSAILDFNASWQFHQKHSLSVQVNNLLDELYYTFGAPDGLTGGPAFLVQAPRHLIATLRFVF